MGNANPGLEHVWILVKTKLSTSEGTRGSALQASPQVTVLQEDQHCKLAPRDCSQSLVLLGTQRSV